MFRVYNFEPFLQYKCWVFDLGSNIFILPFSPRVFPIFRDVYLSKTIERSTTETRIMYLYVVYNLPFAGVGKSCLLLRFSDGSFTTSFITTIGLVLSEELGHCNSF